LDQLRSFFRQIGFTAGKKLLEAIPRFRPIFPKKRDFRQIEARVPELGIDSGCVL
jgi:hypothetical protein